MHLKRQELEKGFSLQTSEIKSQEEPPFVLSPGFQQLLSQGRRLTLAFHICLAGEPLPQGAAGFGLPRLPGPGAVRRGEGESPQASCREAPGWEGEVGLASKQSEKPWGAIGLLLSSDAALPQLISCPGPNPGPALSHPPRVTLYQASPKSGTRGRKRGPVDFRLSLETTYGARSGDHKCGPIRKDIPPHPPLQLSYQMRPIHSLECSSPGNDDRY